MFKSFKSVLMLLTCSTCLQSNSYNSYNSYRTRRRSHSYSASCGGIAFDAVVSILCHPLSLAGLSQGKGIESQSVFWNLRTCQAEAQKTRSPLNLCSRKTFKAREKSSFIFPKARRNSERLHFRLTLQNKIQNDPKRWYTMRIPIRVEIVELPAVSKEHKRSSHE